jgi:hypothetical protein
MEKRVVVPRKLEHSTRFYPTTIFFITKLKKQRGSENASYLFVYFSQQ